MTLLRKEEYIFDRDDDEKLIPQKIVLATKRQEEIMAIPISRGEIKKYLAESVGGQTSKDQDMEIVFKYCISPKYTEKDLKDTEYYLIDAISTAILLLSGLAEKKLDEGEKELKKS